MWRWRLPRSSRAERFTKWNRQNYIIRMQISLISVWILNKYNLKNMQKKLKKWIILWPHCGMAGEQPALHRLPPPARDWVRPGRLPPLRPHGPASGTRPGRHLPPACRQASEQGATRWEWRRGWSGGGRPKGTGLYGTARGSWPLSRPRLDLQAVASCKGSASGPGLRGSLRPSQRLHSVRPERRGRASGGGVCSLRPSEGGAGQRSSRPLLRPFRQSGQGTDYLSSSYSQGLFLAMKVR